MLKLGQNVKNPYQTEFLKDSIDLLLLFVGFLNIRTVVTGSPTGTFLGSFLMSRVTFLYYFHHFNCKWRYWIPIIFHWRSICKIWTVAMTMRGWIGNASNTCGRCEGLMNFIDEWPYVNLFWMVAIDVKWWWLNKSVPRSKSFIV